MFPRASSFRGPRPEAIRTCAILRRSRRLETAKGAVIDVEIFVNCHYGYDIQREVVGEDTRLPEPMAIQMRLDVKLQNTILTDWKDRFVSSYDAQNPRHRRRRVIRFGNRAKLIGWG